MRRRPAAAGALRRPGAAPNAVRRRRDPEDDRTTGEKYLAGETISVQRSPACQFCPWSLDCGCQPQVLRGRVRFGWQGTESGGARLTTELVVSPTGTQSEALLRFCTGQGHPEVRLHLCGEDCPQASTGADLVHIKQFRKLDDLADKTWEENLIAPDENDLLRREQEAARVDPGREAEKVKSSSSSGGKAKKKKKEGKESKKAIGGKTVAQKPLAQLFGGAGLDPDIGVRRQVAKKVKSKLKKNRNSSSSSTGSSSSTASLQGDMDVEIMEDRSRVHKVASFGPGLLTAASIKAMKEYLLQSTGMVWSVNDTTIPPVMSHAIHPNFSGEQSDGWSSQGDHHFVLGGGHAPAGESERGIRLDAISQRLKSLEMALGGQSWSIGQKIELVPSLDAEAKSNLLRRSQSWIRK